MAGGVDLIDRFWSKVDRSGDCWLWRGYCNDKAGGYGAFRVSRSKVDKAHRFSWALHNGEIPAGLHVLHRCDNPPCVNPDHLFVGSHAENMADMISKGRQRGAAPWNQKHLKVTPETAREIVALYATGEYRQIDLANKFGVAKYVIWLVVTGRHGSLRDDWPE